MIDLERGVGGVASEKKRTISGKKIAGPNEGRFLGESSSEQKKNNSQKKKKKKKNKARPQGQNFCKRAKYSKGSGRRKKRLTQKEASGGEKEKLKRCLGLKTSLGKRNGVAGEATERKGFSLLRLMSAQGWGESQGAVMKDFRRKKRGERSKGGGRLSRSQ